MRFRQLLIAALILTSGGLGAAQAQYTLSALVSFNGSNGSGPIGGLVADANGNLYGTTAGGGANTDGTVFEIVAGSHTLTTLISFDGDNGAGPQGTLIVDSSGNLYGTTWLGGLSNQFNTLAFGTVFKISGDTHQLTTLAKFNGTNGQGPVAGVTMDANGNLYGTTQFGGTSNMGTVYQIAASTINTLVSFDSKTNGQYPYAGVILDTNKNLYGMTTNYGTLFKVDGTSHVLATLDTFTGTNGANPQATLIADSHGNFYGTTPQGADSTQGGTVFEIPAGSSSIVTLATFSTIDGKYGPLGGLLIDSKGNLFGTTSYGGDNDMGTVFELPAGSHTPITLASFDGTNGYSPQIAGLVEDADGNLFGTTYSGGSDNIGTVFELSPVPEPSTVILLLLGCLAFLKVNCASC